jgi:hypothetical protein
MALGAALAFARLRNRPGAAEADAEPLLAGAAR